MKRLIPVIIFMMLLSSCTVKNYTPRIPDTYKCDIEVSLGDFNYCGIFCKTASNTAVTVTDTNAKGLEMVFDGSTLTMCYGDYTYGFDGDSFEKSNPAIVLYQVFDTLMLDETLKRKIDGGYKYEGRCDFGEYILIQNDDETLRELTFKNADFRIIFK